MPKQDTIALLDELRRYGLNDSIFRPRLHHLGGSLNEFRAFCQTVSFFREHGCNQMLHERLVYIRNRCVEGALAKGKTFADLADEAKNQVPFHRFGGCKKHVSDRCS